MAAVNKSFLPSPPRHSSGHHSSIRFSRVYPDVPPPLPPRPAGHYSSRPHIPAPLLPTATPPPTPTKKAPWILVDPEDARDYEGSTEVLGRASWVLLTCGTLTMILCFFGIAQTGRRYYLDSSLLSGATSLITGMLGLRARRWTRLPNRNFVSGCIVLSVFSALTCVGLVVLLASRRSGLPAPVTDMVGGAECGIAVLTLIMACVGVVSSRCCNRSPPDNRISHCAEGLTL